MENPRHWRLKKQRYALIGEVCPHCKAKLFPPRDICPDAAKKPAPRMPSAARRGLLLHRDARRPGRF